MHDRFAFTAMYWDNVAVVCRAVEHQPGPVVNQEFGQFQTWTQAHIFATRLNEGLDIPMLEAQRIITSSVLSTDALFHSGNIPEFVFDRPGTSPSASSPRIKFVLAKPDLAVTFCRLARSKPVHSVTCLLHIARNALFDAMHFLCHSDLLPRDLEQIFAKRERLLVAPRNSSQQHQETVLAVGPDELGMQGDSYDSIL